MESVVDIGTEWNLKGIRGYMVKNWWLVDIGTEWNLKKYQKIFNNKTYKVDIGTEWNLKHSGAGMTNRARSLI